MATGAQAIVELLEREGVDVCFGLPGVHNLALWETLRDSPIRLVGVRHEQAAAYAADGYARATGRLGVALTTTGPGAANTLAAVGEAWAARSAVLVIATDIPSALRRPGVYRGVLHETTDQAAMFAPVVKAAHRALDREAVTAATTAALADARTAPHRPVYLEVATDLLGAEVGSAGAPTSGDDDMRVVRLHAPDAALDDAAARLAAAERPLIWAGTGARDAGDPLARVAERLAAPVITTYGAAGVLPSSHPCLVGMPAHVAPAGALWDEADVVLSVGSDLDGVQTQNFAMPQPPTLVAVNLDAEDAAKNYRAEVVVEGDAARVLGALADRLEGAAPDPDGLVRRLREVRAESCATLDDRALRFLDAMRFALPDDAVVVADMCIPGYWLGGFFTPPHPRRLQIPLGWGTLGYAFPASLGAALAGTGPVVAVTGDGGFLFACGELATVAQERIPLTTVIVDDGGYGMLRYDQDVSGEARYGVDLHTPDFTALAGAFGIRAEQVDGLDDAFGEALARHVADPEPSVLVASTPDPLVPPPNTSPNWYRKR
ncbi:MAG TPA: thiamine pyrophosphate-binding protein [Solirubrobacteraceae bacterium]|jgi:acetolactate synthase-1/2/3 large subunit|nr:thiamine pyrophosphate-binding protein [Solirubrobacteraceae bacterium]